MFESWILNHPSYVVVVAFLKAAMIFSVFDICVTFVHLLNTWLYMHQYVTHMEVLCSNAYYTALLDTQPEINQNSQTPRSFYKAITKNAYGRLIAYGA